jgi:hypothetical protein
MAKVKDKMLTLRADIDKDMSRKLDQILTISFKMVKYYAQNEKIWLDNRNDIYNIFFDSFAQTYKLTSTSLKQIYPDRLQKFKISNILNLTYREDGKDFEERFYEYFEDAKKQLKAGESFKKVYKFLAYKLERTLITETRFIETAVKKNSKPEDPTGYIWIIDSGNCEGCEGGKFSDDEIVSFPPFHPNCQCVAWYELTDDPDDIADLDLEVE